MLVLVCYVKAVEYEVRFVTVHNASHTQHCVYFFVCPYLGEEAKILTHTKVR